LDKLNEFLSFAKNTRIIITDFDGVLTDNCVYVSEIGAESVKCSRSDGLAIKILKSNNYKIYIYSSESNPVVSARAAKLNIEAIQSVENKKTFLINWSKKNSIDLNKVIYVGNDLNDFGSMKLCGYKICPSNSHEEIKKIADKVLKTEGGNGVFMEILNILERDITGLIDK